MPKMLILIMENLYPFGQNAHLQISGESSIRVRQTINVQQQKRQSMLSKATFLKNLKNKFLIKVESILEEADCLHILYQHIQCTPLSQKIQDPKYNKRLVSRQLEDLGNYFSNIGIKVKLNQNKVGINEIGNIKYFLGLDFDFQDNPDENYLRCYYRSNMNRLLGGQLQLPSNVGKMSSMMMGKTSRDYNESLNSQSPEKERKSSFATLPSRFNRWKMLDKKLSTIKASVRGHTPEDNSRSQSNNDNISKTIVKESKQSKKQETPYRMGKRIEDRKYSGDIKFASASKKLFEKDNDIRSEYGRKNQQALVKPPAPVDPSQIATKRSRSRIEEMKYREYQELTNSNKNYLKDFMSVLQDEPEEEKNRQQSQQSPAKLNSSQKQFSPGKNSVRREETSILLQKKTSELQNRAREAVLNSMKVIQKFKELQSKK